VKTIRPNLSGEMTMKAKTIWFLISTGVILALAATIIAFSFSTSNSVQERKTQMEMDNKGMWTRNPEGAQAKPAQDDGMQPSVNFTTDSTSSVRTRSVMINRALLSDDHLRALEAQYHYRLPDGRYWYDKVSGAWGMEGGPTVGFTLPGLDLGGPLRADASNGNTRVFINGRELHYLDVLGLQQIVGQVYPGRYWVDAHGYCGLEGGPPLCNLRQLAQAANQHRGGRGITSGMYDSGIGSVGGGGYISGSSSVTR
jgi:hypothetical protein